MTKAAGYIRVSTSGQLDNTSLEDQAQQITDYCSLNNLELLPIYDEGWQSGADAERPELQRLLADARLQKFQFVVVREFSRFGRNVADMLYHNEILKKHNIKLISLKQQFRDDPYGEAMQQMSSIFDELERKLIKERTHGGRNIKWREKKRWIGHLPFGYAFDKEACKIVQVSKEAAVIRRIVDLYLGDIKHSFNDICSILKNENITTKQEKTWTTAHMSLQLKHTLYYGFFVANTHRRDGTPKPIEEHIVWDEDDFDPPGPIMTKQEWDAVQAKAKTGRLRTGRPDEYAKTFLLHALLRCGVCGNIVVAYRAGNTHTHKRYYMCRWNKASAKEREIEGKSRCALPMIAAEDFENWVWDSLMSQFGMNKQRAFGHMLEDERFDEQISDQEGKIANIKKTIAQKERSIRRLDEQLDFAKDDDDYNPTEFHFKRRQHANDVKHLRKDLEAANNRIEELKKMQTEQEQFKKLIGDEALLSSIWLKMDELPLAGKQRLLQGLLAEPIKVYPSLVLEHIKNRKNKILFDAARSKPQFRYNALALTEILGLEQYLATSRYLLVKRG